MEDYTELQVMIVVMGKVTGNVTIVIRFAGYGIISKNNVPFRTALGYHLTYQMILTVSHLITHFFLKVLFIKNQTHLKLNIYNFIFSVSSPKV